MDITNLNHMLQRQWEQLKYQDPLPLPPEAKFITGKPTTDAYLHYLETRCGVELVLAPVTGRVDRFNIVDDHKFTLFLLKWR